jgi:hypothetical protein
MFNLCLFVGIFLATPAMFMYLLVDPTYPSPVSMMESIVGAAYYLVSGYCVWYVWQNSTLDPHLSDLIPKIYLVVVGLIVLVGLARTIIAMTRGFNVLMIQWQAVVISTILGWSQCLILISFGTNWISEPIALALS